jgi:hypothetical protein
VVTLLKLKILYDENGNKQSTNQYATALLKWCRSTEDGKASFAPREVGRTLDSGHDEYRENDTGESRSHRNSSNV